MNTGGSRCPSAALLCCALTWSEPGAGPATRSRALRAVLCGAEQGRAASRQRAPILAEALASLGQCSSFIPAVNTLPGSQHLCCAVLRRCCQQVVCNRGEAHQDRPRDRAQVTAQNEAKSGEKES